MASLRLSILDEPAAEEVVDSDSINQDPPLVTRRLSSPLSVHSATFP